MSFKRLDTEDIVVSSDSITSPAWSNNVVTLTNFISNTTETNSASGYSYWNMYTTGSINDVQFSAAYGHRYGSGSRLYNPAVPKNSYSKTTYGQYRTLINGDENTDFVFGSTTPNSVYFISVERARFKEKILPSSLTLKIGNISLTDNSLITSTDTYKDSGREYIIYSGSAGVISTADSTTVYGKLYPDIGVLVLDGDQLTSKGAIIAPDVTSNYTGSSNIENLVTELNNFTLRAEETLSSNYVFIRARNSEFNYSTNPSNITGSGELQHSVMIDTPQAYITAVGLYNDNNELLAVSKLSKPLLKDFTKESLIRIKLDF